MFNTVNKREKHKNLWRTPNITKGNNDDRTTLRKLEKSVQELAKQMGVNVVDTIFATSDSFIFKGKMVIE